MLNNGGECLKKFLRRIRLMLNVKKFVPFLLDFYTSKQVTITKKLVSLLFIIGYILLPFDLIPDFFMFIGIVDDIAILAFVLQKIVDMAPQELKTKHNIED